MREVPRRPRLLSAGALIAAFFGGAAIGEGQAAWLAPESAAAEFVSFFHLPLAFVVGVSVWMGMGIVVVAAKVLGRLLRGEGRRRHSGPPVTPVPSGAWIFLPVASASGLFAGLLVGGLTSAIWTTLPVYWATGTIYGAVVFALANAGYLPFPDASS